MKRIFSSLVFLLLSTFIPLRAESLYVQLCRVNSEWKAVTPDAALLRDTTFTNDEALIRMHLLLVENRLRNTDVECNATQCHERAVLLDVLHLYALTEVFPKNTHHPDERRPYFIDDFGTHCAVGYLIMKSGHEDLAQRISADDNYAYLRDIKTDGLTKWQVASGFTVNELAWIQPTYRHPIPIKPEPIKLLQDSVPMTPVCDTVNFRNGKTWYCGAGSNGVMNGPWKQYYANGQLFISGQMKKNLRSGKWNTYNRKGQVIAWTRYNKKGEIKSSWTKPASIVPRED